MIKNQQEQKFEEYEPAYYTVSCLLGSENVQKKVANYVAVTLSYILLLPLHFIITEILSPGHMSCKMLRVNTQNNYVEAF